MSHRLDGYLPPQTAASTNGKDTSVSAQSALGIGSTGGNVTISSGTGTSSDGNVIVYTGATARAYFTPTFMAFVTPIIDLLTPIVTFDGYQTNPSINQLDQPIAGLNGNDLSITSQKSTSPTASGGNLILTGGDGYSGDGNNDRHGTIKLFSGPIEAARIIPNKVNFLAGQRLNLADVGSSPFDIADDDHTLMVDTSTIAITLNLPATPTRGDFYVIKDRNGSASTHNITVSGNGKNIETSGSYTINTNYGFVKVVYNDTDNIWNIF